MIQSIITVLIFSILCRALTTDITPQESEIDDARWFDPKEVLKMDTYEDVIKTIEFVIKRKQ